jgi:ornithine cyclodeaminase/alanine dehydrogenase-like protein (mu-crystallin family)
VDVIVSATNAPEPVVGVQHVAPGQHLNAIGIRTELTPELVARCRVIGDGREETLLDGKFSVALAAGAVAEEDLGPDLGTVLDGTEGGRRNADEITIFDSSGVAIQDIVCAVHVHERASAEGIGTLTDLGSGAVLD